MLRKEMRDFYPKNVSNSSVVVDQNKKSASFSPIGRKIPLKWKLSPVLITQNSHVKWAFSDQWEKTWRFLVLINANGNIFRVKNERSP